MIYLQIVSNYCGFELRTIYINILIYARQFNTILYMKIKYIRTILFVLYCSWVVITFTSIKDKQFAERLRAIRLIAVDRIVNVFSPKLFGNNPQYSSPLMNIKSWKKTRVVVRLECEPFDWLSSLVSKGEQSYLRQNGSSWRPREAFRIYIFWLVHD